MVLDYKDVEWKKVENFKGGEKFVWMKMQDDGKRAFFRERKRC